MKGKAATAVMAVIFSSLMFGALGLCTRYFRDCGLSSNDVVVIRLTISALGLSILLALFAREQLVLKKKYIPFMILFGLFKFLTDLTFFHAQGEISLCLATLLQMTAPYFVMIFSLFLFRERITGPKLIAMVVGSIGCVMVTGVLFGRVDANTNGILSAILSGLFISMFFIGNRIALEKDIGPATMLFYTTLFADLIALPFAHVGHVFDALSTPTGLMAGLALGLLMTLIPYYLLTWSSLHIEPTIVSMISVLEVGAAAVVGYFAFNEPLDVPHIIGIALVVLSIILVNVKIRLEYLKRYGKYISPLFKLKNYSSRYDTIYVIPPRYGPEIKGVPHRRILIRKAVRRK